MEKITETLIKEAKTASESNFCCNDSHFSVGAALLTKNGKVYKGFNIENDGLQSICAERVAFAKALSEGNNEFSKIVVVGKFQKDRLFKKTLPCGYCRQFMRQYGGKNLNIVTYDDETREVYEYKLRELLPESFDWGE